MKHKKKPVSQWNNRFQKFLKKQKRLLFGFSTIVSLQNGTHYVICEVGTS